MSAIRFVKDKPDFDQHLLKNKYLVAQFTASWCGPCEAIRPIIDGLYASDKYRRLEIVKVDLDKCGDVASHYSITSVPTFIFFEKGKEFKRIQGASLKLVEGFDELNEKAAADPEARERQSSLGSDVPEDLRSHIPLGFQILNDVVHFGELVSLNTLPLVKNEEARPANVFKVAEKNTTVLSDADSQALFFVPLNNISKVYSVLLKISSLSGFKDLELELDEDELLDETQPPLTLKLWVNKPGIMSFDDAVADKNSPHSEKIDLEKVAYGWYEAKLKFVRFQNVQNLTVFIDGEDEDKHTVVDKIVLVGLSGDSKDQGTVQQLEDD